jgi:hypothetical protein
MAASAPPPFDARVNPIALQCGNRLQPARWVVCLIVYTETSHVTPSLRRCFPFPPQFAHEIVDILQYRYALSQDDSFSIGLGC